MTKKILIRTQDLTKSYDNRQVVGPLNLELWDGDTVALLGANGAGKTTLFQILTGHLDATLGEAFFRDQRIKPQNFSIKKYFGYLPQNLILPPWVSGKELLNYCAALHELKDAPAVIEKLLNLWEIAEYQDRPIAACSHGMQKRIGLALAMIHEPTLMILDEPFTGLDIYHLKSLEELLVQRSQHGLTTIISTHDIPYAARICSRILMMKTGHIQEFQGWQGSTWEQRVALIEREFFKGQSATT